MAARFDVRKATVADAEELAPRMREADAVEVRRSAGFAPLEALVRSLLESDGRAFTLRLDGQVAAMFGLVKPDILGVVGIPWLLTSDLVERAPVAFFRAAREMVDLWSAECPTLLQFVDEEYTAARRFLARLGFTIHPPVRYGPEGAWFCPAVRSINV